MTNIDKKKFWLIEIIIWGVLLFSVVTVSKFIHTYNTRAHYTYFVFFKDIDGVIIGSPVKIQGVQVGHVSNIKFINDEVFVTFVITDKNFKMPTKMDASVSFTGMGGSKSLELFVPPEGEKAKNFIRTKEPMRLQDFMFYSNETSQILLTMMNDAMRLMNDNTIKVVKEFIRNPKQLEDIEESLDNIKQNEESYLIQRRNNELGDK